MPTWLKRPQRQPEFDVPPNRGGEKGKEQVKVQTGGILGYLRSRLQKTRQAFVGRLDRLLQGREEIDADTLEEIEELLITADLGVETAQRLLASLEKHLHRRQQQDPGRLVRQLLKQEVLSLLQVERPPLDVTREKPFVIMAIGVNGVGKTTTVAKLAHHYLGHGLRPMLVAADTFRAAAVEQLSRWAERLQVELVKQQSGADPAAVAFDALNAARARDIDVVLVDTAGRLHTKVNLMEELKKIKRVMAKQIPGAPHETMLVLDATTGQNAISQARMFNDEIGVDGLVLTKMDGTAKGGIIAAITAEFGLPVRFVGLGEGLDDLRQFDPASFVEALF